MSRIIGWLFIIAFIGAIVGAPIWYGMHLWQNYAYLQKETRQEAAVNVQAQVDSESVSEIGYIFGMRRENHIRDKYRNLVWFIAVPATGERFSCIYSEGFPDFKTGDGVMLIHNTKRPDEAESGYIVGLHDDRKDKVALVGTNDLDNMELDDPGDQ